MFSERNWTIFLFLRYRTGPALLTHSIGRSDIISSKQNLTWASTLHGTPHSGSLELIETRIHMIAASDKLRIGGERQFVQDHTAQEWIWDSGTSPHPKVSGLSSHHAALAALLRRHGLVCSKQIPLGEHEVLMSL